MLLSLIKELPADQRRVLSGKLQAVLADSSIDQDRKAEVASSLIKQLRAEVRSASEETSDAMEMLEEQTHTEEEMPESAGIDGDAQGGAPLLDSTEGQPDRVGSGISEVDMDDVKAKDIGKSGDFQAGDAIRDDSVVSIMSMGYEGCCIQEESLEAQRQGHGVVDCDYDYGGGV